MSSTQEANGYKPTANPERSVQDHVIFTVLRNADTNTLYRLCVKLTTDTFYNRFLTKSKKDEPSAWTEAVQQNEGFHGQVYSELNNTNASQEMNDDEKKEIYMDFIKATLTENTDLLQRFKDIYSQAIGLNPEEHTKLFLDSVDNGTGDLNDREFRRHKNNKTEIGTLLRRLETRLTPQKLKLLLAVITTLATGLLAPESGATFNQEVNSNEVGSLTTDREQLPHLNRTELLELLVELGLLPNATEYRVSAISFQQDGSIGYIGVDENIPGGKQELAVERTSTLDQNTLSINGALFTVSYHRNSTSMAENRDPFAVDKREIIEALKQQGIIQNSQNVRITFIGTSQEGMLASFAFTDTDTGVEHTFELSEDGPLSSDQTIGLFGRWFEQKDY